VHVRSYEEVDRAAVIALWEVCGLLRSRNDPHRDIDRKLAQDAEGLLVLVDDSGLVGAAIAGYDGHRGWVNYLAVHPDRRRTGGGRLLMAAAEAHLAALGCPKVNLQVRAGNQGVVAFYEHLGYAVDEVVSMGRRLVDDD
jgi:ribosomal protein S18 acetylase RimI-like enzyme